MGRKSHPPHNTAVVEQTVMSPIYWFAELHQAMEAGELERATVAQRELDRLGYRVQPKRLTPAGVA